MNFIFQHLWVMKYAKEFNINLNQIRTNRNKFTANFGPSPKRDTMNKKNFSRENMSSANNLFETKPEKQNKPFYNEQKNNFNQNQNGYQKNNNKQMQDIDFKKKLN